MKKNFLCLIAIMLFATTRVNAYGVEDDFSNYTQVEWLESVYPAYTVIDDWQPWSHSCGYDFDGIIYNDAPLMLNTDNVVFGFYEGDAAKDNFCFGLTANFPKFGRGSHAVGWNVSKATSGDQVSVGVRSQVSVRNNGYDSATGKSTITWTTPLGGTYNEDVTLDRTHTSGKICIFGIIRGQNSPNIEEFSHCRIYSLKFYEYNTVVRDLVPVVRRSDGVAGLYEKKMGKFYSNQGGGKFVTPVAQNTTTDVLYTSAQAAVDAAQSGETVKLLVDFHASLVVSNNITVDLNGKTVYNNLYLRNNDGEATVMNGRVNGTVDGKDGYSDSYNGTVNLRNLVLDNNYDLFPDGHTINIYGGQYYGIKNHSAGGKFGVINIYDDAFIRLIDAKGGTTCLYGGVYKTDYSNTANVSIASGKEVFLYSSAPTDAPDGSYVYGVGPQQYSRSTTNNRYGTICLYRPSNDITGATFYSVAGKRVDGNGDPTSIVLEEVTNIEAGKPYIFLGSGENLHVTYSGLAVAEAGSENGLVGCFTGQDVAEGMYLLSNNEIVKCGTGCTIGANRAYINMAQVPVYADGSVAPVKMAVIGLEGADGIDGISIEGDAVHYNLSGVRIPAGTKGIVIVNGKKVINK